MNIKELAAKANYRPMWTEYSDREITGGFTSDLLSDVMANAEEGEILFTIQAHKNSVAVAMLKDLAALVICSDRPVPDDMIAAARDEDLPLFVTEDNQYTASWRFHELTS